MIYLSKTKNDIELQFIQNKEVRKIAEYSSNELYMIQIKK